VKDSCPPSLPVSVIIPAYNAEGFLAEAIASVRRQRSVPREIIVVDDGSTDGTRELAKSLGVQLHEQKNCGVSVARNTGVKLATSPWIAFLDADDVWEPEKLALQWTALEIAPSSLMCITGSRYFNERGELPGGLDAIKEFRSVRLESLGEPGLYLCEPHSYARALARVNFIVHSAILISREVFQMSGGYDEKMRLAEDLDWLLRVATFTSTVLVKAPLTRIRTHATNSSRSWDRMVHAHIAVGLKAARQPELYPEGVVEEFEKVRADSHIEAGLCLLRSLDAEGAEREFRESRRCRWNLRAAVLSLVAFLAKHPSGKRVLKAIRDVAKTRDRLWADAEWELRFPLFIREDDSLDAIFTPHPRLIFGRMARLLALKVVIKLLRLPRRRQAVLTFDDGPFPGATEALLDVLRSESAPATFFLVGNDVVSNSEAGAALVEAGMEIASHSASHRRLTGLTREEQRAEVAGGRSLIEETLAVPIRYFRPPHGAFDRTSLEEARASGQIVSLWNVDPADYESISAREIIDRVMKQRRDIAVILLHSGRPETVLALPEILRNYRALGYIFTTLGQLTGIGRDSISASPELVTCAAFSRVSAP
jgi:peptidoglycan/xylan/chitin deacetylase (PgdA/CDA1 family)/GT2 family glycosyltransferase